MSNQAEIMVIGGGPGGYAAAFKAADLGKKVVLIEQRAELGGVCLNEGCIPSKALLHVAEVLNAAEKIKQFGVAFTRPKIDIKVLRQKTSESIDALTSGLAKLAKRRKIRVIEGSAKFTSKHSVKVHAGNKRDEWRFDKAIIAVGSRPIVLDNWPLNDARIMDSTDALALKNIPANLTVVGGSAIGLEMATIYNALGSKVTIVELQPEIIAGADKDAVRVLRKALEKSGCVIHTSTKVASVDATKKSLQLVCEGGFTGTIMADAALLAVGRESNGALIDAHLCGVKLDSKNIIAINSQCATNIPHIYAVGDVTGAPMLAHSASHQGKIAAKNACGHRAIFDNLFIPSVVYTNPELARVGLSQNDAQKNNVPYKTASFPWFASGRNLASGSSEGLTKITYCPATKRILGGVIVGSCASELIAELTLALEMGATLEDIAHTIHAHPSLSETNAFAAEVGLGTCLDL